MASNKIFNILNTLANLSDKDDITSEFNLIQCKEIKNPILDIRKWNNSNDDKNVKRYNSNRWWGKKTKRHFEQVP